MNTCKQVNAEYNERYRHLHRTFIFSLVSSHLLFRYTCSLPSGQWDHRTRQSHLSVSRLSLRFISTVPLRRLDPCTLPRRSRMVLLLRGRRDHTEALRCKVWVCLDRRMQLDPVNNRRQCTHKRRLLLSNSDILRLDTLCPVKAFHHKVCLSCLLPDSSSNLGTGTPRHRSMDRASRSGSTRERSHQGSSYAWGRTRSE